MMQACDVLDIIQQKTNAVMGAFLSRLLVTQTAEDAHYD